MKCISQKPQNPRQVWKHFFLPDKSKLWDMLSGRTAGKKKTNNKEKIIQLLEIYREDKREGKIREDLEWHISDCKAEGSE